MGIRVNRIEKEFVFKKLLEKGSPVKIICKNIEVNGKITGFDDDYLYIEIPRDDSGRLKETNAVSVFFWYENNQHTFNTKIHKAAESQIIIVQPEKAYKDLKRQYERLKSTEQISVSFTLKGRRIQLDFPKTAVYHQVKEIAYSPDFDAASIKKMIQSFRQSLLSNGFESSILMLRNKAPSGFIEQILVKTGKILFIPSIKDGFLIRNDHPEYDLLLYQHIKDFLKESGVLLSEIGNTMQMVLKNKQDEGIISELYCPILYNEYAAGYIRVYGTAEKKGSITINTVKYVNEFSNVLCYSLKKNHYFRTKQPLDHSYTTPIIDISASGLLFAHSDKFLSAELKLHSKLDITLKMEKRRMEVEGEIMRKYKDDSSQNGDALSYVAVKYKKIAPEDFRFLYELIYGKPYSVEPGFTL